MEREKIIHKVQEWAAGLGEPIRMYFFGSRHKGTHRDDSDVDFAIEAGKEFLEEGEYDQYWWFSGRKERWKGELHDLLGLKIDLDSFHPDYDPNLRKHLTECSEVIFDNIKG